MKITDKMRIGTVKRKDDSDFFDLVTLNKKNMNKGFMKKRFGVLLIGFAMLVIFAINFPK